MDITSHILKDKYKQEGKISYSVVVWMKMSPIDFDFWTHDSQLVTLYREVWEKKPCWKKYPPGNWLWGLKVMCHPQIALCFLLPVRDVTSHLPVPATKLPLHHHWLLSLWHHKSNQLILLCIALVMVIYFNIRKVVNTSRYMQVVLVLNFSLLLRQTIYSIVLG